MDRIDVMRLFARVADGGSFSAAAREAGVGQPTVSKQIAGLERRLGAQLVRRTSRGLSLTAEGRAYYAAALRLLADFDAVEAQVCQGERAMAGLVRVTAPPAFAAMYLMPRLPDLFERHPRLSVEFIISQSYLDLVEGGIDLAIRMGDLLDSNLLSRTIGTVEAVTVASPDYLARRGAPQTPADLERHDCIASIHRGARRNWRFEEPGRVIQLAPQGPIGADDTEHSRAAMLAGLGVVQGPNWLFAQDIAQGRAQAVLTEFPGGSFPIRAVWSGARALPHRARVVVDFLAQACAEEPTLCIR